jgi:molybdopterin-binding protein
VSNQDASNLLAERAATHVSGPRNRLPGTILAVKRAGLMAEVEMACGPYRIVSIMSRDAADELDLQPGDQATAVIKSATIFIESTDRPPLVAVR